MTRKLSSFPNAIDTFIEHFDITADDVPKVKKYQELKLKTSLTDSERTELENLTTLLRNKIITSEDWNKFQEALVNMQVFIKDEVEGYIQGKQQEFQNTINKFRVIGIYKATTDYKINNMVKYSGCLYMCLANCRDVLPTDTNHWIMISTKGDKGESGIGLTFRGIFDSTNTYYKDDLVRHDDSFYYAIKTSTNIAPPESSYWDLYMYGGITKEQYYNMQITNIMGV
ncbi:hypothetical protein PV797_04890 [Clostridiaceae bacterium M8S5]|nr:hypothetical protein PV797_04890 [Clostridiaceae bacterium M8S5]